MAALHPAINVDDDPELLQRLGDGSLNRVVSPDTGQVLDLKLPVVVHSPKERVFVLVIPASRKKEEIRFRMGLLRQLAEDQNAPPPYILDFRVAYTPFGAIHLEELANRVQRIAEVDQEERQIQEWKAELAVMEQHLEAWAKDLGQTDPRFRPPLGDQASLDEITEDTAVQVVSPYLDTGADDEEVVELTTAEIEVLRDAPTEAAPVGSRPVTVQPEVLGHVRDLPERAPRPVDEVMDTAPGSTAALPEAPVGFEELHLGQGHIGIADDRIAVHFAVESHRLVPFLERKPDIFLQLHRLTTYPVIALLLVARDDMDRLVDELFCVLDIASPDQKTLLDRLQERFTLDVHLYDDAGRRLEYLQYQTPLELNVTHCYERAHAWLACRAERSFEKAVEHFSSGGYERIGAQRHNFHRASFSNLQSAQATKLAVSMVGYWSEPQNTHYLIENRSFPLAFFEQIQRRVIDAAIRFGIFLPVDMRRRAQTFRLAATEAELLGSLVDTFAKVSTAADCDLDPMGLSENWDQLLTACVDLGVPVDETITELGNITRRQSRRRNPVQTIPPELEETEEYQRVQSVAQASNEDLRDLLSKGGIAPDATRELLGRGGDTNIFHVIEAARFLDDDDLRSTARFLAAGAEHFEPALLIGLGRIHPKVIHLCALALASARRTEALPALFELLHDRKRAGEIPIREIIAEYGSDALPSLFAAISKLGVTDELVEVMALISVHEGSEIIKQLRMNPSGPLLEAAQKMTAVRRRLGSRRIRSLSAPEQAGGEGDE